MVVKITIPIKTKATANHDLLEISHTVLKPTNHIEIHPHLRVTSYRNLKETKPNHNKDDTLISHNKL